MENETLVHLGDGLYEKVDVGSKERIQVVSENRDRHGTTLNAVPLKEGEEILLS